MNKNILLSIVVIIIAGLGVSPPISFSAPDGYTREDFYSWPIGAVVQFPPALIPPGEIYPNVKITGPVNYYDYYCSPPPSSLEWVFYGYPKVRIWARGEDFPNEDPGATNCKTLYTKNYRDAVWVSSPVTHPPPVASATPSPDSGNPKCNKISLD